MDINKIRAIVNAGYPKNVCEQAIIEVMAADPKVIETTLHILAAERSQKRELLLDTNARLSTALFTLIQYEEGKRVVKSTKEMRTFIVNTIFEHYHKWKDVISCNFNLKGLPDYKE